MAEVIHLFRAVKKHEPMEEIENIRALENRGLEGCVHGRPGGGRQVLLMDAETLSEFGLLAGLVRENITTRGIAIAELREGQRVRAGDAILEVQEPCEPCEFIESIRPGLQRAMHGRRGVLCRVIRTGSVRRGDQIGVVENARNA